MKENLTEIVCVLDRSGSMGSIVNDAIGGFNTFLRDQKTQEGEATITVVLFDHEYKVLHNGVNIQDVPELDHTTFVPRGSTALNDAIGKSINEVGARLARAEESERPSKVIFVILTDGGENASKEFTAEQVKEMINHQKDVYSWMFVFLAANQDAFETASNYGISKGNAMQFASTSDSANIAYMNTSAFISRSRGMSSVDYTSSLDNAFLDSEKDATGDEQK